MNPIYMKNYTIMFEQIHMQSYLSKYSINSQLKNHNEEEYVTDDHPPVMQSIYSRNRSIPTYFFVVFRIFSDYTFLSSYGKVCEGI